MPTTQQKSPVKHCTMPDGAITMALTNSIAHSTEIIPERNSAKIVDRFSGTVREFRHYVKMTHQYLEILRKDNERSGSNVYSDLPLWGNDEIQPR